MGDFRVTIEAIGGHGCGRGTEKASVVTRCARVGCPDCLTVSYVESMKAIANVQVAKIEHWPVPGAAGTTRTEKPGPIDDLLAGTREGKF